MDKAKEELMIKVGVDANTQYVHFPVSFDGAYSKAADLSIGSKYCFASAVATETGKVVAYRMAYNRCKQCDVFESKFAKENVEYHNSYWTQHRDTCLSPHKKNCGSKFAYLSTIFVI